MKKTVLTLALVGGLGAAVAAGAIAREHNRDDMRGPPMGRMMNLSPTDREAFLDARLAAVRAGLKLTPEQDKLWGPVEAVVRDNMKTMAEMMEKARAAGKPADMMDGLTRMTEAATARAEGLRKLTDAARPLYATLAEDQKARLPVLLHGMGRGEGHEGRHWMR